MIISYIPVFHFFVRPVHLTHSILYYGFVQFLFILATQILSPAHACFYMLPLPCSATFVSYWALCSTYKPAVIDLLTQSFVSAQTTESSFVSQIQHFVLVSQKSKMSDEPFQEIKVSIRPRQATFRLWSGQNQDKIRTKSGPDQAISAL